MSEDDKTKPTEGLAADKEKAKKPPKAKPAKKAAASVRPVSWFGRLITLLTLLIAMTSLAGVYYLWQQQGQRGTDQQNALALIKTQLSQLQQLTSKNRQQAERHLKKVKEQQDNLANTLKTLIQKNDHLRNDWLMAEAEYLIRLANHRLLLVRDVNTAIVALQAADDRLREVADPALIRVRTALAKDINNLRAAPQVDTVGISLTLSAITQDIERLPLLTPDPATVSQRREDDSATSQVSGWQELPAAMWRDIKGLIVIREHDQKVKPLLSPEQRFFLTQNLRLQLEQARFALLNGDTAIYGERLNSAEAWIKEYFDTQSNVTKNTLSSLQGLKKQAIHPKLPDVSATFKLLRHHQAQQSSKTSKQSAKKALPPAKTTPKHAKPKSAPPPKPIEKKPPPSQIQSQKQPQAPADTPAKVAP